MIVKAVTWCLVGLMTATWVLVDGQTASANGLGKPIEIDSQSEAEIYLLGRDERPADNIYGEQPYGDATGRRIAIRYYSLSNKPGGINILDLQDGSLHEVLSGHPHETLIQASNFVQATEEQHGLKIACIEEIAYRQGFIDAGQLEKLASEHPNQYGQYLVDLHGQGATQHSGVTSRCI